MLNLKKKNLSRCVEKLKKKSQAVRKKFVLTPKKPKLNWLNHLFFYMGQMKLSIFIFGVFSSLDWSKSVEIKYIFSPFSRSQNSLQEKEDNEAGKRGWECVMNRIEYVYLSIKDAHYTYRQYNYMKITIYTLIGTIRLIGFNMYKTYKYTSFLFKSNRSFVFQNVILIIWKQWAQK